jgi:RNA polymerase sigma-70 factor (ECF subfamily)
VASSEEFARLTDPYRHELLAYCYRMLGSVHDAEDQVQEILLRAWRSYDEFEGRSSLRTWLYRIATNSCLRALENRRRRPLPSGLRGPSDPDGALIERAPEVPWLQPIPDALLSGGPADPASADPASIVASRAGTRLALIAALQYLPARQRAVLILRDVLGWRAAQIGDLLGTTTAAVNSVLQRARASLQEAAPAQDEVREPADAAQRALVDRYATAFENADITGLMQLLTDDAVLEMPPRPDWFAGREHVGRFIALRAAELGPVRTVPTAANGQPALAVYRPEGGAFLAHSIQVFTVTAAGIGRIMSFLDPGLFATFGLPTELLVSAGRGLCRPLPVAAGSPAPARRTSR